LPLNTSVAYGGDVLEKLQKIRKMSGKCDTHGINDDLIKNFLENDPFLSMAIDEAERNFLDLINELIEIDLEMEMKMRKLSSKVEDDFIQYLMLEGIKSGSIGEA
jgi:hypothetical protein